MLQVIQESLRIESPSTISSAVALTQDTVIYDKVFRSDTTIFIANHRLHVNKNQWIEPDKFIPERFNPSSPYFLTPEGTRRSPMSFVPFLGGKRICVGKTFAELVAKSILPIILCQLSIDIPADSDLAVDQKPSLSHFSNMPNYYVQVTDKNLLAA